MVFVRRNARYIGDTDQGAYRDTVLGSRANGVRVYQEFAAFHAHFAGKIHWGLPFLAWHRLYILAFEHALRQIAPVSHPPAIATPPDPNFTLPYWRWHIDRSNDSLPPPMDTGYLWRDEMVGGKGPGGEITGPFGKWEALKAEKLTADPVDPADPVEEWQEKTSVRAGTIKRHLGAGTSAALPNKDQVKRVQFSFLLLFDSFDVSPFDMDASLLSYRNRLEGFAQEQPRRPGDGMHNDVHDWTGGSGIMADVGFSPNDPVFWLHHAECDRLWWLWQNSVRRTAWWPDEKQLKHAKADPDYASFTRTTALPPWDGRTYTLGGGTAKAYPKITVADVLDIENLPIDLFGPGTGDVSYRYDRTTL